jgi:hypothetical protein
MQVNNGIMEEPTVASAILAMMRPVTTPRPVNSQSETRETGRMKGKTINHMTHKRVRELADAVAQTSIAMVWVVAGRSGLFELAPAFIPNRRPVLNSCA